MRQTNRIFIPILIIFLLANLLIYLLKRFLVNHNFDLKFLFIANCILFAITISSLLIHRKAMLSPNNQAFIRAIYTSMLIKFFVCLSAIFFYIITIKGEVNQPGLFSAMALYIVYTAFEVSGLMKAARKKDA